MRMIKMSILLGAAVWMAPPTWAEEVEKANPPAGSGTAVTAQKTVTSEKPEEAKLAEVPPPDKEVDAKPSKKAAAKPTRAKTDGKSVGAQPQPVSDAAAKPVAVSTDTTKPAKVKKAAVKAKPATPEADNRTPQQKRLDELLEKYRADQISPKEYHQERAQIMELISGAKPAK